MGAYRRIVLSNLIGGNTVNHSSVSYFLPRGLEVKRPPEKPSPLSCVYMYLCLL